MVLGSVGMFRTFLWWAFLYFQVTSLRQFRVTCQEKSVEIQLRLRMPDANGRVMHFILRLTLHGPLGVKIGKITAFFSLILLCP